MNKEETDHSCGESSMELLLKAEHRNWGLITQWDWHRTEYTLMCSGELHIVMIYDKPMVDCSVKISDEDLTAIKDTISRYSASTDRKIEMCDGAAWQFAAFDPDGKIAFSRKIGYVADGPQKDICDFLLKNTPERPKPVYPPIENREPKTDEVEIPNWLKTR